MKARHALRVLPLLLVLACDAPNPTDVVPAEARLEPAARGGGATLIFHNGVVHTMERERTAAQAIAIRGNRILAVGSDRRILRLARPKTAVVDLQGATVLPGIVDAHTHIFNDAEDLMGLSLREAQDLALRVGITTLGDLWVDDAFLPEIQAFHESGALKVRTSLYLGYGINCGNLLPPWWQAHPPTREFGERLRVGGIKLYADGGSCGEPAVSVEFSTGSGFGDLWHDADAIALAVRRAERMGHQTVIHAIGDRAVKAAQDGIELVLQGRPNRLRHRIDHNVLVPSELIARYTEIGIQPVLFGRLPLSVMEPDALPFTCEGAPRNAFYQAFEGDTRRILLEAAEVRLPVSPFRELHNMVTRIRRYNDAAGTVCPPQDWQLKTRVTARQGLEMMTANAAYALFREREVGTLRPAKLADLIVVSANPVSIDPDDLWDIVVWMTMIDGRVEYCREGFEVYCPAVPGS